MEANRTIGFLKRNLNIVKSDIKEMAYTALVRPTVEYANSVWDPHLQKDINKLDKGEVKIDAGNKLLPPDRLSRHTNVHSFQIPSCKTSIRKESFYSKTIRDWNNLLAPLTAAESFDSFKRLLLTY